MSGQWLKYKCIDLKEIKLQGVIPQKEQLVLVGGCDSLGIQGTKRPEIRLGIFMIYGLLE